MSQSLIPCSTCGRHVNTTDPACPFCGSTIVRPDLGIPVPAYGAPRPPAEPFERVQAPLYGAPPPRAQSLEHWPVPAYGGPRLRSPASGMRGTIVLSLISALIVAAAVVAWLALR